MEDYKMFVESPEKRRSKHSPNFLRQENFIKDFTQDEKPSKIIKPALRSKNKEKVI